MIRKGGLGVYIGYVLEEAILHLDYIIELLLKIGNEFNFEKKYENEYFEVICLLICLNGKVLTRDWFKQVNDWICFFCNLQDVDLKRKYPELYKNVMDFTTDFCWNIGYCGKSEIYVRTDGKK